MDSSKIVQVAKKYLGKEEKPSNTGWKDSEFERRMKEVGWLMGQAWCAYFVELTFKEAYPEEYKKLESCFDASAVKTFQKFKEAGYPISKTPVAGSIVIWQTQKSGKPYWQGHAAICSQVIDDTTFKSIEGNTSASGSREGYIVAEKLRKVQKVTNGLQVLGFIKLSK